MIIFKSQYFKIIAYIFDIAILFLTIYNHDIKLNDTVLFLLQIVVKVLSILYQELLIWYKIHPDTYKSHLPEYFSYTLIHPLYHIVNNIKKYFKMSDHDIKLDEIHGFWKFLLIKTMGFYIAVFYIIISCILFFTLKENFEEVELDVLVVVIFMSGYYYDVLSEYISLYEFDQMKRESEYDVERLEHGCEGTG